jgi:Flp pilus assembly protein TadG
VNIFRRLARNRKGMVLVEFAFAGPPFLFLLCVILDLSMMLATQMVLEGAARDAARLIRTGQAQSAGSPITTFQTLLCSDMSSLMSVSTCDANVIFEVQTFGSFGAISMTSCTYNANNGNPPQNGTACSFTPGTGGQIVSVQASYSYPFMIPWVSACFSGGSCWFGVGTINGSTAGTGTVPLVSTVIFKNEPFT